MIHKLDDGTFAISSHDCWMPGCYESEKAARYAFRFCEDFRVRLQDEAIKKNAGRTGRRRTMRSERHATGWRAGMKN